MGKSIIFIHPPKILSFFEKLIDGEIKYETRFQIENLCDDIVAFRIRSNAKRRYFVQKSCGFIIPNERINLWIIRRENSRFYDSDCFIIQTIIVSDSSKNYSPEKFWKKCSEIPQIWKLNIRWPPLKISSPEILIEKFMAQIKGLKQEIDSLKKNNVQLTADIHNIRIRNKIIEESRVDSIYNICLFSTVAAFVAIFFVHIGIDQLASWIFPDSQLSI